MAPDKKSILVIGSSGHKNATNCIEWGELAYVGDYDFVIVNTVSLTKEVLVKILQNDEGYFEKLRKDITDVQQNKGIALTCVLGKYAFSRDTGYGTKNNNDSLRNMTNNYSWSPVIPVLEKIPTGEKLNKDKASLPKEYLDKINGYDLLYDGNVNNTRYVDKSQDGNIYTKCHQFSLLDNTVGRSVAFSITWKVHQFGDYNVIVDSHLPIEFIPAAEKNHEGIDILINEFCKGPEELAPEWITEIILPGEKEIRDGINIKTQSIDLTVEEIKNLGGNLAQIEIFKKLLYSQGAELEDVVEKSLALLGIVVKKPSIPNVEDRFFETPDNQKIYFEIRGVNRLMNENDLSQLIKRVAEKPVSSSYKTRGVFVFNHQNNTRPTEREKAFHHNIENQAKSFGLCLIESKTLFKLVESKLNGEKVDNFDQVLFNSVGIFAIKKNDQTGTVLLSEEDN